jgi:heme/copper-type cytochrome/quinol oxidase subunit 1
MGALVRRYLKTAVVFLFVGLISGGALLVRREVAGLYPSPMLVSAHAHVILVGFVMMMILGVAQWMFPRLPREDGPAQPRAPEIAYWILTVGTTLRFAAEVARAGTEAGIVRLAVVTGGLSQIAGLALFFYGLWPRIRTAGARARGE